jgi:hypothetical protein
MIPLSAWSQPFATQKRERPSIEIAAGTFELEDLLELKANMTLKGADVDKTVLTHTLALAA